MPTAQWTEPGATGSKFVSHQVFPGFEVLNITCFTVGSAPIFDLFYVASGPDAGLYATASQAPSPVPGGVACVSLSLFPSAIGSLMNSLDYSLCVCLDADGLKPTAILLHSLFSVYPSSLSSLLAYTQLNRNE